MLFDVPNYAPLSLRGKILKTENAIKKMDNAIGKNVLFTQPVYIMLELDRAPYMFDRRGASAPLQTRTS